MRWQEVVLTTTNEAVDAASNIFFDVGFKGVVIEDPNVICRYIEEDKWDYYDISPSEILNRDMVVIKGYLPFDMELKKRMQNFYERISNLKNIFEGCEADVSTEEIMEEDWASSWQKYYKTIKVGKALVIRPKWEAYEPLPGEVVIVMNPGAAFGTGTHPTTAMCMEMLEKYLKAGQIVFDVGCGSGILSIAAIKIGAHRVYARDIDSVAVKMTRRNSILNEVESRIKVEAGNFLNEVNARAHVVLANLTVDAIIEFSPQAYKKLLGGGIFIASGIINKKAEDAIREIKATGFEILESCSEGGWVVVVAQKKSDVELVGT